MLLDSTVHCKKYIFHQFVWVIHYLYCVETSSNDGNKMMQFLFNITGVEMIFNYFLFAQTFI